MQKLSLFQKVRLGCESLCDVYVGVSMCVWLMSWLCIQTAMAHFLFPPPSDCGVISELYWEPFVEPFYYLLGVYSFPINIIYGMVYDFFYTLFSFFYFNLTVYKMSWKSFRISTHASTMFFMTSGFSSHSASVCFM